jgi:competence protein ComFB
MAFADQYDFDILVNQAEEKVVEELGRQLDAFKGEICRCGECVIDMAAVSLNSIKPLYRVSLLGTLYASQAVNEADYAASLRKAVAGAIEKVRKNPSHD